ncbi:MAG: helix-turn-helix domain-containing protein [Streptosporangiales bacterium]|nr:helix-turn-helix domain-containing protein [Streptosporangiales bacterium]
MVSKHEAAGWIGAGEAARRLGVKPATLYAYVSRGVLRRRRTGDGRRSLFDSGEIEELARRGRPRRPPSPSELVIESQITVLGADRPYYRGRDALELAAEQSFEAVAAWLWTGTFPEQAAEWRADPGVLAAGAAAQRGLPAELLPLERLQVIVAALGATDPLRFHLDQPAVIAAGHNLIAGMVDCLPPATLGDVVPADATIPARLWGKLCPHPPTTGLLDLLRSALVLLADHELAASTLAARVAASVRADPYAVVAAGLGVLGGPLHGGASLGAEAMLAEVRDLGHASRVIGERLRRGERIPGLGHRVYTSGDRRATYLLDRIRAVAPESEPVAAAEAVLTESRRRRLPEPNIDLAVATLAGVADMIRGAGEAIFAVARTAGWLAHALEEYEHGTPLRPRAVYTGPEPRPRETPPR